MENNRACFDIFYRKQGDMTAYAVAAGLEQAVEYVKNLHFSKDDIAYLRSLNIFDEAFLTRLSTLRFTGEILAVPEGTVIFPGEPIVRVIAPIMEAQLLETALLNIINHQTLIATKASRVVQAARGDGVLEFGLRRAQGPDAGIYGARAAMIGGCRRRATCLLVSSSACPSAARTRIAGLCPSRTSSALSAHTPRFFRKTACCWWIPMTRWASGVPNAITVFGELRAKGYEPMGIRLDSGDLAFLSRQARKMLDEAGFPNAKIFASGDLDEEVIWDLKAQGAAISVWGVGTRMITSMDNPALGGVYKLSAEEVNGKFEPRIKISENPAKITNPGVKRLYRFYDRLSGKALADLIALEDEDYSSGEPLEIFDPENTWKKMTLCDYEVRPLLAPIFENGEMVYTLPTLSEISEYAKREMETFWDEYKRLHSPHRYKVDLSKPLYELKRGMLEERRSKA